MKEILLDCLIDTVKLIPFLFVAFFVIELFEHRLTSKGKEVIASSGKFGPLLGSIFGVVPQCGFSVMATNLYVTRIISLGTLISIYLTTSDEMLPIMLSEGVGAKFIITTLAIKFIIGLIMGFIIDVILRKQKNKFSGNYEICKEECCHCENGILVSSIKHTLSIVLFIFISSLIIGIVMHYSEDALLNKILLKNSIFGPFLTSLLGLIPSCASSVIITQLYLGGAISFGSMISGLLTGSGAALLVLFKANKNLKENIRIVSILYGIGVAFGMLIILMQNIF